MLRFHNRYWYFCMFVMGSTLFAFSSAPAEEYAASSQEAESGDVFTMPAGDHSSGPLSETSRLELPAPGDEFSFDDLLQMKQEMPDLDPLAPPIEVVPAADSSLSNEAVEITTNSCGTNVSTGFFPSYPHGAVTSTNLIMVTNVDIGVYRKSDCGIISRLPLRTFFGSGFFIPASETLFNPRALYDRRNRRCLVLAESRNSGNTNQFLYVAGSRDSTCTSWRLIRFRLSQGSTTFCKQAPGDYYDYPNAGMNRQRLVVTSNNFRGPADSRRFNNSTVLSIDSLALYGGGAVPAGCFDTGDIFSLTPPVVGDGNSSMYILARPDPSNPITIRRFRLDTALGGVAGDRLFRIRSVNIPSAPLPPDAAQPNGQRLGTVGSRFVSASKQIGDFLWNVHSINVGGFARWRLYKMSNTGTSPIFIFQPTTSTCANRDHLFMPSLDTNSSAPGARIYVTATRTCPSQAVIGRAAHLIFRGSNSSASGWVFTPVATSAAQFTNDGNGVLCNAIPRRFACRWGDYTSTQIDPSNTSRAWGFNQLVTGARQSDWTTRGAQVQ